MHSLRHNRRTLLSVTIIACIGLTLRVICCFWGFPYELHPNEHTIVDNAIDMLSRHSWIANVYNRPDQFEIKCLSFVFHVFSQLAYDLPAYEAFSTHQMEFTVVARIYTALFGTALIPLATSFSHNIGKRLRLPPNIASVTSAALIAFSPSMVRYSAYATPDVVLSFMMLLYAYALWCYINHPSTKTLVVCSILIGCSISIKYPAAVLIVPLELAVLCMPPWHKFHKLLNAPLAILVALATMFATTFIIAPNLFLSIDKTIETLALEARPNHLGADGLGFFGNLAFYAENIVSPMGLCSVLPFALGVAVLARRWSKEYSVLLIGPFFLLCISFLSLHWERWVVPVHPFYCLACSIGVAWTTQEVLQSCSQKHLVGKKALLGFCCAISLLSCFNSFLSSFCVVKESLLEDSRIDALRYCEENGITQENSLYDGYTPFRMDAPADICSYATVDNGMIVPLDGAHKQFLILSNKMRSRYVAEPNRYLKQTEFYKSVDKLEMVQSFENDGSYRRSTYALVNIPQSIDYLLSGTGLTGSTIWIYRLPFI